MSNEKKTITVEEIKEKFQSLIDAEKIILSDTKNTMPFSSEDARISQGIINQYNGFLKWLNTFNQPKPLDGQRLKDKLERYSESYFRKSNTYTINQYVLRQIIEGFLNEINYTQSYPKH